MTAGPPIEELHFDDAPDVGSVPGPRSRELLEKQERIDPETSHRVALAHLHGEFATVVESGDLD